MVWTKHFSTVKQTQRTADPSENSNQAYSLTSTSRTSSWLNIAYQGNPQRIPRYYQFQEMDTDSDINTALDTIADFCTQSEEQLDEPFEIKFHGEPNESEVKIIKQMMDRWIKLNSFTSRLWYMFRDTIKNGDAFFLRDPETQEWLWMDHFMVELVKVDETKGKVPDEYIVRGLDYNRQAKFATVQADPNAYRTPYGTSTVGGARPMAASGSSGPAAFSMAGAGLDQRMRGMQGPYAQELHVIDADHVVHLSLSVGNDINWPFGQSILEPIFKTYKQKELLEDAIIIYRVQRAPERRIFYIDVGTMPPERAKRHIEAIKNDIHQRRIPNRTGTGGCFAMDTQVPLLDGRVLTISEIAAEMSEGKINWAYSCDPTTGLVVPGKITWAGITRRDAQVVRLTLDNGETIICTPDHKFPIFGRGIVEAQDIVPEVDSLISLNTRLHPINKSTNNEYQQVYDHEVKVLKFEILSDTINVGTLTIDGAEEFHNYHNFALQQGVFACNSILDAAYNPMCISLSTMIPLLDGRTLTLSDLITEYRDGKENWVYSCDPKTGEITKGPITWAGVTRHQTDVVCVTLDNGGAVICTPDHKFPTLGGELVEAQNLKPEHRLITRERFFQGEQRTGHGPHNMYVHPLVVVPLEDKIDVGTITVDKEEIFSPFHNFAISENIFLQNSINDDYFFACLRLSQKILLLDGRSLTLEEIITEHEQGKENWVYSQNTETFELEPGRIKWAGITRKNAEMVRVTLDNGEYIDATPDHRFITRAGEEVEAQHLQPGDSMMPLYLRKGRTGPRQKNEGYTRYLCNATSKTKFVHTQICPKPKGREYVVHHKDFNGENNNPTNLEVMRWKDHEDLHRAIGTYSLQRQWNDPAAREKLQAGMRAFYDNATPAFMQTLVERNRKNGSKTWDVDPETRIQRIAMIRKASIAVQKDRRLQYSEEMFARVVELFEQGYTSVKKICQALLKDAIFVRAFQDANKTTRLQKNQHVGSSVNDKHLNAIVVTAGYRSWGDFKESYHRNHKVVSVEFLPFREDTGDITIETASGSHIFALEAGIFVHNSSSDGRGSKVETLPGGEAVGEINDLSFFSKKLARGLRVPTSYLNIGDDDSSNVTFNDGKLGSAMIQEYRFSKFCMRLQSLLAPVFDYEFKRFLKKNGIEIEIGLFEITFNEPQSFTKYRQLELDAQRISNYSSVAENRKISERIKFKRYLGWSDDEIIENEKMWSEENAEKLKRKTGSSPAEANMGDGLSSVGLHPEGGMDDMGLGDMGEEPTDEGLGAPGGAPPPGGPGGAAPPPGGPTAPAGGPAPM